MINWYNYGKQPPNTFLALINRPGSGSKERKDSPLDLLANFANTLYGDTSNSSEKHSICCGRFRFCSRARLQVSPLTVLNLTCFTSWLPHRQAPQVRETLRCTWVLAGGQRWKGARFGAGFGTSACVEDCKRVWQVGHNDMRSWTPAGLSHVAPPASPSGRKIWASEHRGGGEAEVGVVRMTMGRLLTVGHTSRRGQSYTNPWKQTRLLLTATALAPSLQKYSLISLTIKTFGSYVELISVSSFNKYEFWSFSFIRHIMSTTIASAFTLHYKSFCSTFAWGGFSDVSIYRYFANFQGNTCTHCISVSQDVMDDVTWRVQFKWKWRRRNICCTSNNN